MTRIVFSLAIASACLIASTENCFAQTDDPLLNQGIMMRRAIDHYAPIVQTEIDDVDLQYLMALITIPPNNSTTIDSVVDLIEEDLEDARAELAAARVQVAAGENAVVNLQIGQVVQHYAAAWRHYLKALRKVESVRSLIPLIEYLAWDPVNYGITYGY